jgi:hypothetical protein
MPQLYWWILEEENRLMIEARLAEAERDRLAKQAANPARGARALLADALRGIAGYLDGDTPTVGERRLSPAR